jgi:hypothetical protein
MVDEQLRQELLAMRAEDRSVRQELVESGEQAPFLKPTTPSTGATMPASGGRPAPSGRVYRDCPQLPRRPQVELAMYP